MLIKCHECGNEISDKAKACIHCGYTHNYRKNMKMQKECILLLSAGAVAIILCLVFSFVLLQNASVQTTIGSAKSEVHQSENIEIYGGNAIAKYEFENDTVSAIMYEFKTDNNLSPDERFQEIDKIIQNVEEKHSVSLLDDFHYKMLAKQTDKNGITIRCALNLSPQALIIELSKQ